MVVAIIGYCAEYAPVGRLRIGASETTCLIAAQYGHEGPGRIDRRIDLHHAAQLIFRNQTNPPERSGGFNAFYRRIDYGCLPM